MRHTTALAAAATTITAALLAAGCADQQPDTDTSTAAPSTAVSIALTEHTNATTPVAPSPTASSAVPVPGTTSAAESENDVTFAPGPGVGPNTMCDLVPSATKSLPVIVLSGHIQCEEALDVATRYLAADNQRTGQGMFLTIDRWSCSWPYVEGRTHADSYYQCTDHASGDSFKIGN